MKIDTQFDYIPARCDHCQKVIAFGELMIVNGNHDYCSTSCFISRLERRGSMAYVIRQEEKGD